MIAVRVGLAPVLRKVSNVPTAISRIADRHAIGTVLILIRFLINVKLIIKKGWHLANPFKIFFGFIN